MRLWVFGGPYKKMEPRPHKRYPRLPSAAASVAIHIARMPLPLGLQ
jgi:hypothetical protein